MYMPEYFKKMESCLVVCPEEKFQDVQKLVKDFNSPIIRTPNNLADISAESKNLVFVYYPKRNLTHQLASQLINICKPGSKLIIQSERNELEFILKVNGFINLYEENCSIICEKPIYQLGSSARIEPITSTSVWKIDDEEIIDSEELLDENDLQRPDPALLRVCGSTGQRKACKNCSCGLNEELAADIKSGNETNFLDTPQSSCGNCYLGDAFRCASCPYLGMPAFKLGEKIQLSDNQLKSDL